MSNLKKILTVFTVGAAIGTATALLYAPRSGRRTRRSLRRAMDHGLDRFEAFGESLTDCVNDVGLAGAKRIIKKTQETVHNIASAGGRAINARVH
jgi:gas vesicle protein